MGGLASPMRNALRGRQGSGRGGGAWSPGSLAPYAWYDAHLGGSSTQITDSSVNARAAATNGASAAAATWLPYDGPTVYLPGTASNYISAPDSAALSFSNDIEVVCRIKPVDWSAAANQTIVGKYNTTGNQRSWRFYISTTGQIALTASADGTAVTSCTITPSSALTDNVWVWARMRLDLTNGSNSVGTLETAADTGSNANVPASFTANGSATSTTLAGIFDSTAPLEIGSFGVGASERLNGWIGRVIVRSGFDGTVVADFNADDCAQTGYTATSPAVTWTVNRATSGLKSVVQSPPAASTRSMLLFGTNDYIDVPSAAVPPLGLTDTCTVVVVARLWATPVSFARLWSTEVSGSSGIQISVRTTGQTHIGITDGTNSGDLSGGPSVTLGQRAVVRQAIVARGAAGTTASLNNSAALTASNATVGAITTTVARLGAHATTGGNLQDFEFEALITFNRALTSAEVASIVAFYGGGL